MQKIIPVSVKVAGIVAMILTAVLPLLVVNITMSWQGPAPPNAPSPPQKMSMRFTSISFTGENATYNNETNKFVVQEIDTSGSDSFSVAVRTITTVSTIILLVGIVLAAVGALLTALKGKTKLGAAASIIGSIFMLLLFALPLIIQTLLLQALAAGGGTVSGNSVTFLLQTIVEGTTYTLAIVATIKLGFGAYLAALGGILTIVSVFMKSDD